MAREGEVGALEPDKYADLIVLSKDYFAVLEDEIRTLSFVLTLVGGNIVYAGAEYAGLDQPEVIGGGSPVPIGEPSVYQHPTSLGWAGLLMSTITAMLP
jgi:hypothetical protein